MSWKSSHTRSWPCRPVSEKPQWYFPNYCMCLFRYPPLTMVLNLEKVVVNDLFCLWAVTIRLWSTFLWIRALIICTLYNVGNDTRRRDKPIQSSSLAPTRNDPCRPPSGSTHTLLCRFYSRPRPGRQRNRLQRQELYTSSDQNSFNAPSSYIRALIYRIIAQSPDSTRQSPFVTFLDLQRAICGC